MSQSWRCCRMVSTGPRKGLRCTNKPSRSGFFCRKHRRPKRKGALALIVAEISEDHSPANAREARQIAERANERRKASTAERVDPYLTKLADGACTGAVVAWTGAGGWVLRLPNGETVELGDRFHGAKMAVKAWRAQRVKMGLTLRPISETDSDPAPSPAPEKCPEIRRP